MTPKETYDYLQDRLNNMEPVLRDKMLACLQQAIPPEDKELIRAAIAKDPYTWWSLYHHGWGTAIRNLLRNHGFGEKETGIENLDDVYIQLVELAVKEQP
jgi:hypothetical protein